MTGLPIIETKGNDVSAYIPTNVISITDGQCFLETDLFNAGVRPAINVGISVSRVGGSAQTKAMKQGRRPLRLSTSPSSASWRRSPRSPPTWTRPARQQLERGQRLVELLKQPQYSPFPVGSEIVSIWAGTTGPARRRAGGRRPPLRGRVPRLHLAASATASSRHARLRRSSTTTTSAQTLEEPSRTRGVHASSSSRDRQNRALVVRVEGQHESGEPRASGEWATTASLPGAAGSVRCKSTRKITKAMEPHRRVAHRQGAVADERRPALRRGARSSRCALAGRGSGRSSRPAPMITGVENPRRAGIVLVLITSDRGLAGLQRQRLRSPTQLASGDARERGQGRRGPAT